MKGSLRIEHARRRLPTQRPVKGAAPRPGQGFDTVEARSVHGGHEDGPRRHGVDDRMQATVTPERLAPGDPIVHLPRQTMRTRARPLRLQRTGNRTSRSTGAARPTCGELLRVGAFGLARALSLVLLAAGCVSERLPAVVQDGESLWRRVETEHFVVESNLGRAGRVREVASDFETLWHAFASVPVLGLQPPGEKPLVVVFADEAEYRYFAGSQTAGFFMPETVLGPLIALPPNRGPFQDLVVRHELAHFMCSEFLPDAPLWLHEGLAQVMETADYDTKRGEILFGDFLRQRVEAAGQLLPARRFTGDWPRPMSSRDMDTYYGKSWLLVHYLIDNHLQEFLDFVVLISRGEEWKTAWADEIPLRFDRIDEALAVYHRRARYGLWRTDAELPDLDSFVESPAPPADVLALRSLLHAYAMNPDREREQKLAAADRDLRAARELDPRNARVARIAGSGADPGR